MLAHAFIFLPLAGFMLAVASGVLVRSRRERDDKRARDEFKISG